MSNRSNPSFSFSDLTYGGPTHPKHSANFGVCESFRKKSEYVLHVIIRQLSAAISFASRKAILAPAILVVFFSGSEKKMTWIYAVSNVALVAYTQPFRNWPIVDYPRCPMGEHYPAFFAPESNYGVSTVAVPLVGGPCPQPARAKMFDVIWRHSVFVYSNPKSLQERFREWVLSLRGLIGNFVLHGKNSFFLLCRAPGDSNHAGAFLYKCARKLAGKEEFSSSTQL